ncbi:hypothetical protein TNCV_1258641 [Trichonephila clavipes]|nr:hypothetical protein TNCV_1258641 [Trichonephila clavipes]
MRINCGDNDIILNYTSYLRKRCHKFIKIGRLRFVGHICHMDSSSLTFRINSYKTIEIRTGGRLKLRWVDCVEDDFKVLRVTNWRTATMWRSEWKRVFGKALATQGCCVN